MKSKLLVLLLAGMLTTAPVFANIFPCFQMQVNTKRIFIKQVAFFNNLIMQRKISKSLIYKFHIRKTGKFPIRNRFKSKSPFIKRQLGNKKPYEK